MSYKFIGASVGDCAGITGCQFAPDLIKNYNNKYSDSWAGTIYADTTENAGLSNISNLEIFSNKLANLTKDIILSNKKFITLGGDHSCAISTWSSVSDVFGDFGLIWIDAHLDAHTPESSQTGNLHGMPVATLLGYGDSRLTKISNDFQKIKPENLFLIGIRSYEKEEKELLENLGVKIFLIEETLQIGFQKIFNKIINDFNINNLNFGISLDVDGIDPKDIPAVGTSVDNGISLDSIISTFKEFDKKKLIGCEIVEYNPLLDNENKTSLIAINNIIESLH